MTSIYIGNLPYDATQDQVADLFKPFGTVERVTLVSDRETGRPRGFGFVEMPEEKQALQAIEALSGQEFEGRPLTVNQSRNRSAQRNSANLSRSAQQPEETDEAAPSVPETPSDADESNPNDASGGYSNQRK